MRSPLFIPTTPKNSTKYQDPKKENPETSDNHAKQESKSKTNSQKLRSILKRAAFPSVGLRTRGSSNQKNSFIAQMEPLLTPSPRHAHRKENVSFTTSPNDTTSMSPLLNSHLFSEGFDPTLTSNFTSTSRSLNMNQFRSVDLTNQRSIPVGLAMSQGLTFGRSNDATSERSLPKFTSSTSNDVINASDPEFYEQGESETRSMQTVHSNFQDYMKSGRPFPPNESERHIKILVRTGLRDLSHLAEELNSKARISSLLDAGDKYRLPANNDRGLGKQLKRSNSSSAKVNYTDCANSKKQIHRTVHSSTALPGETEVLSSSKVVATGIQEVSSETPKVLRKRLFDQKEENQMPEDRSGSKTSAAVPKVEDNAAKHASKESTVRKFGKRLSLTSRNEDSEQFPKTSRNSTGRRSLDSKYTTLLNVDAENKKPKNAEKAGKDVENVSRPDPKNVAAGKKVPRRIFKTLFENN